MFLLVLAGCSSAIPDNPTAKSFLKENPYLIKSVKLGEIKKMTSSSLFFKNFYATKLPIGTEIFATNEHNTYTIIVELDGEQRIYKALVEG